METGRKSIRLTVPTAVWKHYALLSLSYNIPLMELYEIAMLHSASCNYFHELLKRKFNEDFDELLQQNISLKPLRLTDSQTKPNSESDS